MKLRLMAALIGFAVVGGLAGGIVMALWTGSQTASGSVNAASSSVDLYICEPNADPANSGCGPDDSGADETIFEGTEDLLPGNWVWAPVRLRNVGSTPLDILSTALSMTEVSDPGGDCGYSPMEHDVTVWELGKWYFVAPDYYYMAATAGANDNHYPSDAQELQVFPKTNMDGAVRSWAGWDNVAVHIAPGDYEDMAVRVRLPLTTSPFCENGVWNIAITWTVVTAAY